MLFFFFVRSWGKRKECSDVSELVITYSSSGFERAMAGERRREEEGSKKKRREKRKRSVCFFGAS